MGYRADMVPCPIRPFYRVVTWALGLVFYLYYFFCRITSQVSIEGPGNRGLSRHAVFCLWHESGWSYFVAFVRYRSAHAAISHPATHMNAIHTVFRLMGLKRLLLGSSGEEGKQAARELAGLVQNGRSTTISPDGPYGLPRTLKKGVLPIALQSGVPVTICSTRFISWRSWDSKRFPLPFNRIKVIAHEAIHVNKRNFEQAGARIVKALGGPEEYSRLPWDRTRD
jgi:lysophospholipid acyltransferase (LPLAT)-like uncharacterized protein